MRILLAGLAAALLGVPASSFKEPALIATIPTGTHPCGVVAAFGSAIASGRPHAIDLDSLRAAGAAASDAYPAPTDTLASSLTTRSPRRGGGLRRAAAKRRSAEQPRTSGLDERGRPFAT